MPNSPSPHSPPPATQQALPRGARGLRAACAALALALPLAIAGCYPDQISDVEDLDTITTLVDTTTNFSAARRYALVDSVVPIPADCTSVPKALSDAVIQAIRTDMNALGWTEETNPRLNEPDVVITAGIAKNTYVYADWYSYWGYWPYWDPAWSGWGWYWTYPVVYSYDVGSLVVTMIDGKRAEPKGIPIAWVAAVRGVADGAASNQARAVDGVHQAFEQSPYLQVGAPASAHVARSPR
jgi:hypothetical protein